MATLKCGMYSFIINYEEYCDKYGFEDYTYSLKIRMWDYPLFSDTIEKQVLAPGGKMVFTSDESDHLLEAFKTLVDESSPLDKEIAYYSEIDGPQQVLIKLIKTIPPRHRDLVWYYITFDFDGDSFEHCPGVGSMRLITHTIEPEDIKKFVTELEQERGALWAKYKTKTP
ncbi:MAG: hypothetical protein J6S16_03355 [Bacteroidales bacterium]|nr:hypothetical protein [Bacteroidales bacterium]